MHKVIGRHVFRKTQDININNQQSIFIIKEIVVPLHEKMFENEMQQES